MGLLYLFTTCFSCPNQPSSVRGPHTQKNIKGENPLFAVKEASLPSSLSLRGLSPCIFFCVSGTYLVMVDLDSRNILQCIIKD